MRGYVATGGKINRPQQLKRLEKFVKWAEEHYSLTGLEQIGKKHVIDFWKANRKPGNEKAGRTADGYWSILCEFWKVLNRTGEPPRPKANRESSQNLSSQLQNDHYPHQ